MWEGDEASTDAAEGKEMKRKSRYERHLEKERARGLKEGRNYPPPEYEGQTVTGIYCPMLACTTPHASMVAKKRAIKGKEYIVWVYDAPCLERVHKEALRLF